MASPPSTNTTNTTTSTNPTLLRVEKALLRGRWNDEIPSSLNMTGNLTNENKGKTESESDRKESQAIALCKLAVEGRFREVLVSDAARAVFGGFEGDEGDEGDGDEERPFTEVFGFSNRVKGEEEEEEEEELSRLAIAVSCLHAFIQANWTGPDLDFTPSDLVAAAQPNKKQKRWTDEILQRKSIAELARGGEPAYHLSKAAFLVRIAEIVLVGYGYKHLKSVGWWRVRVERVHQQILDEPVGSSASFEVEKLGDEADLAGRMYLERGVLEHVLRRDKAAGESFVKAARATGMEYELTGALGRRTKFQVKDLSQLVLIAESRLDDDEVNHLHPPETVALNDDTLLEQTEFTSSANQPALHPLDQAILLSLCLNVQSTSPSHGLTSEQMSAYVARVLTHPRNWSIHTMALLLRSRLESTRTRTVDRAVLQLQALIDQMPSADSSVGERLMYFHTFPLPSRWVMEKELAGRYMELGVVNSALAVYERLEMWEEVVGCYAALERREKALGVVRDLLDGTKITEDGGRSVVKNDAMRTAKLYCLLGDLDPSQAISHYTTAWTLSSHTSGRAMRSLGAFHFARANYTEAIICLNKAVKINPLLSRSWFILGCACMREERWWEAREAFARCVGIDEEDGESWNNLASMYLRTGGVRGGDDEEPTTITQNHTEQIPFTNKLLAYRALKQGLRYAYENWRMWYNYMIIAVDVGELNEACRALGRIVEQTGGGGGGKEGLVDVDVVERLVDAVTRGGGGRQQSEGENETEIQNPNEGKGLYRNVRTLFDRTLLPRISNSPRIFRAYARLLMWNVNTNNVNLKEGKEEWEGVVKAYMDAYRCGAASSFLEGEGDTAPHEQDDGVVGVDKWREAVREVQDIVDILRNYGPKLESEGGSWGGGEKWRSQARSIVRRFMGRTREVYEGEEGWDVLAGLVDELKTG